MQYLGGKSAIAAQIAEVIKSRHPERDLLIEPFCGGGAMTAALAPLFREVRAYDIHPDLILMWQAVAQGWEPPDEISETEWKSLKYANPSALRGFAGFGTSYGGMFFGGFARPTDIHPKGYAGYAKRTLLRDIRPNVTYAHSDFSRIEIPAKAIIYADPPYSGTADYKTVFSTIRFWHFARKWIADGATLYVSEYRAPEDFVCVWEAGIHGKMKGKKVTEKLFVHKDQL